MKPPARPATRAARRSASRALLHSDRDRLSGAGGATRLAGRIGPLASARDAVLPAHGGAPASMPAQPAPAID